MKLAKQAVIITINDMLLIAEANRRNVPSEEIVRKESRKNFTRPAMRRSLSSILNTKTEFQLILPKPTAKSLHI